MSDRLHTNMCAISDYVLEFGIALSNSDGYLELSTDNFQNTPMSSDEMFSAAMELLGFTFSTVAYDEKLGLKVQIGDWLLHNKPRIH